MRHIVATILAFNCCFIQAQVDWELRFSGDVWNVAFGENHDFLTTRTSVFRSDAGLNEWTECNWTLGIVREGTSIVNGLSWNNDRLVVAALDNGYFMSSDLGESFVQTGPTGFGCASESILDLEGGSLVATMGGFQRGLWKCEAPPSTDWNKNYSVGADQRDIQQIGEDLFAVSHASNHPGGILRSSDFGGSWELVFATEFFGNPSCFSVIGDLFIFISWDGEVHHIDMLDWTEVATFETELLDASDMCEIDGALFLSRRNGGVYRSEDLGQTWVDVGPNTSSFYIVKKEGEELYAAGESGLWAMPLANFSSGCTDESACNFDAAAVQDDGSCIFAEDLYPGGYYDCYGNCMIPDASPEGCCEGNLWADLGCADPGACNYNPFLCPFSASLGCTYPDDVGMWCPSCECDIFPYDCDYNIIPEHDVNENGIIDCYEFAGCTDESACNYDPEAVQDDGSCTYPEIIYSPCGDCYTDCSGNIINDWDGDGICDNGIDLPVCSDPWACNYDPNSCGGFDDFGVCIYPEVISTPCGDCLTDCYGNILNDFDGDGICDDGAKNYGCPDPLACNYAGPCVTDVAPCDYPPQYYNCDFECNSDSDGDGTCDELEVLGCTSTVACNFLPTATEDDGTCEYGACHCLEGTIWDVEQGGCVVANPSDTDFDGCVSMTDLLDLLSVFGTCEETSWSCGDPMEYQDYDYETVQIGGQCWFAEDLHAIRFSDDSDIPEVVENNTWENLSSPARYEIPRCLDGSESSEYSGMLYNGFCVRDERGLCPSGWTVPTDGDWQELEVELGMDPVVASQDSESGIGRGTDQGKQLKAGPDGVLNWNGEDVWGFNVVPGGSRNSSGNFNQACFMANYWSSSQFNADRNFERRFRSWYDGIGRQSSDLNEGWSVRCIQVEE